ncbi:hypothetical protein [Legionella jordanis]|nr:hypothetical protein [Legionella jordanis]RMX02351.1 hypothetical protein EAW55_08835 [Legionella jordanis]RMX15769.1 hypothetical protein EAS68_11700 [Legionella jordanis]HAT8714330.1 hypothetical protein [Legionella jordanis]
MKRGVKRPGKDQSISKSNLKKVSGGQKRKVEVIKEPIVFTPVPPGGNEPTKPFEVNRLDFKDKK